MKYVITIQDLHLGSDNRTEQFECPEDCDPNPLQVFDLNDTTDRTAQVAILWKACS
jgi:hypothetical protein